MPVTEHTFGERPDWRQFAPFEGAAHTFEQGDAAATTVDGRDIVVAGTIYPTNDEDAKGIVLYDVDVTDGDGAGTLVYSGTANEPKLTAMAAAPTDEAKMAMPGIRWFPTMTHPTA